MQVQLNMQDIVARVQQYNPDLVARVVAELRAERLEEMVAALSEAPKREAKEEEEGVDNNAE